MPVNLPPIVLTIAGHDPSGGAGIQADIEAIDANGCIAASVITCLTVQDTTGVKLVKPLEPELISEAIRTLLADLPIRMFKIGLIGSAEIGRTLAQILGEFPDIPLVLDPVLASGDGKSMVDSELLEVFRTELIPRTLLLTPNLPEALRIAETDDPLQAAERLRAMGCTNLLLTGAHAKGRDEVINRFYPHHGAVIPSSWPRLPGEYHGSGCTLAAAAAALLARGLHITDAMEQAQHYTWHSLRQAFHLGKGQAMPDRLHKVRGG